VTSRERLQRTPGSLDPADEATGESAREPERTQLKTRVKVCCISSLNEASLAVEAGVDAVGLVSRMPSGPGPIADDLIAEIAAAVPPGIDSFLLTSQTEPEAVVEHVRRCRVSVVQLVSAVPHQTYAALREQCPGIRIVQVVHVEDHRALEQAQRIAPRVDAVLLDSGRPGAEIPELGGTGRQHDWSVSALIVRQLAVPVFLAGGLHPGNVAAAIRQVSPFGVDLCSGVRMGGSLDEELLREFLHAVHEADRAGRGS